MEQTPDSQDVGNGAAQEEESVADTSDWCSEWSRSPLSSWNEEEKSNQKHDTCGAGEQDEREQHDGWAEEQKGGGTPVTVTPRVTVSRGAEWGHRRSAATTRAKPDWRGRWRRKSRVGRCREMASTARLGVSPYRCGSTGWGRKGRWGERGGEAAARAMR